MVECTQCGAQFPDPEIGFIRCDNCKGRDRIREEIYVSERQTIQGNTVVRLGVDRRGKIQANSDGKRNRRR